MISPTTPPELVAMTYERLVRLLEKADTDIRFAGPIGDTIRLIGPATDGTFTLLSNAIYLIDVEHRSVLAGTPEFENLTWNSSGEVVWSDSLDDDARAYYEHFALKLEQILPRAEDARGVLEGARRVAPGR